MRIDCLTTFPNIFDSYMNESMMKRAQEKGILEFFAHQLRDWTHDSYQKTDDYVYGGGEGLVMKCEPIFEAIDDLTARENSAKPRIIIAAPQGKVFDDALATELSCEENLIFICGHYEGIDERVYCLATDVISIGDYVLTSGELSSMVIIDAVVRKIPGVLNAENGAINESFASSLLEHPQYTRPASYRGLDVPEVLTSGNDKAIQDFNRHEAIRRTWTSRPDLIEQALRRKELSEEDQEFLRSLKL